MALQSLNDLKNFFKTNLIPTQQQFWDMLDSFRHKSDKVAATDIDGLTTLLAAKASAEVLTAHTTADNAHAALFGELRAEIQAQLVDSTTIGDPTIPIPVDVTGNAHCLFVGPGTYANWGGLTVPANNIGTLKRVEGVFSVSLTAVTLTDYAKTVDVLNIIGEEQLTEYPEDFSLLSSLVNSPATIWINNSPLLVRGVLKYFRVKAPVGSIITPYAYSISGAPGSFVYTELHSFAPFTTTALIQTQEIDDSFILEVGQFIGFKSSLGIYYTTSGSGMNTSDPFLQSQTYSSDFIINENTNDGLTQQVETLESSNIVNEVLIAELQDVVGREPVLMAYSKNFAPLTNQVSSPAVWINNTPITTRGTLKSIRVKAPIGATVTPYVYTVAGEPPSLVLTENHAFNPFVTTALEHTETIEDDYIVEVGQLIGYKSPAGIYYATGLGETSYVSTSGSQDAHSFAYDFVLDENTTYGLLDRVTALEENINAQKVILKPVVLYKNNFSSLADFVAVNWSASANVATPSATGIANHVWLQNLYNVMPRRMSIDVVLLANSDFRIHCASLTFPNGTGYYSVNANTNSLVIYNSDLVSVASGVIDFTIVAGRKYNVALSIVDWKNTFEIKDTVTGETFVLEYAIETDNLLLEPRQNETYKIYLHSGTTSGVGISNLVISSKKNPLVCLGGDSITEGALFSTANFDKRFAILLREKLKGNVLISARGGAHYFDIIQKITSEIALIKPDYFIITIGTNNGLTAPNLTTIVNAVIALGVIPIINHIPNGNAYADHEAVNAVVDSVCLATGAIRGCLFDVATSIDNNPANGGNPALYDGDMIHPNVLGQAEMFKRFEIDLPFLFT